MNDKIDKNNLVNIDNITKRLDVIIYLLLKQRRKEDTTTRQMIEEFNKIGLKDHEIAKVFGKSRSYIASELSLIRKSKSTKSDK